MYLDLINIAVIVTAVVILNIVLTITICGWMTNQTAKQLIGYQAEDQLKNEKRFVYLKEVLGIKEFKGIS